MSLHASGCSFCRGNLNSAAGYWKKAGKGGKPLAMYKLGVHFYKGDVHVLGRSAEDAAHWLKKFLKQDPALVRFCPVHSSARWLVSHSPEFETQLCCCNCMRFVTRSSEQCRKQTHDLWIVGMQCDSSEYASMKSQASLILGYLHMDGEGTKRDNAVALQHMREAADNGSDEAKSTLGWMYNTGQFGN
jgi:TPR repeat protein